MNGEWFTLVIMFNGFKYQYNGVDDGQIWKEGHTAKDR